MQSSDQSDPDLAPETAPADGDSPQKERGRKRRNRNIKRRYLSGPLSGPDAVVDTSLEPDPVPDPSEARGAASPTPAWDRPRDPRDSEPPAVVEPTQSGDPKNFENLELYRSDEPEELVPSRRKREPEPSPPADETPDKPAPPPDEEDDDTDADEDTAEDETTPEGVGVVVRNRGGKKGKKGNKREPKVIYIPPPTVGAARPHARHWGLLLSFFLVVVAPFAVAGWYLTERAVDQYASTMGFSVRKEDASSNFDDLSTGLFGLGSQSSSDTDVLYEFIQSQDLVEKVDGRLDLRAIYSKPTNDPVFSLQGAASVEELVEYWQRMVTIYYDAGSGLMEVRVLAFDAQDAQNINSAIFEESSTMINALTAIARDDSTGYAREDLERALEQLRQARVAITNFRVENKFVTPDERIQQDNSILGVLNQQLVEAEIEQALLLQNARADDPRVRQGEDRIRAIRARIEEEKAKFGTGDQAYAKLVGEYESLVVDREFAESSYLAALTNFNGAVAEATRQSRYLAPHIRPTLAQTAEFPQRTVLLGMLGLILLLGWAISAMLYYSIKDRR